MNPEEESQDQHSARNIRSDAIFFQRRLVSRPSFLNLSSPDPNLVDTSAGSTVQSSPSINSFANSTEEAKSSPFSRGRPLMASPHGPRDRGESTDDSANIQKDVAAFVTGKAIRDAPFLSHGHASDPETSKWILSPEGRLVTIWDAFILVLLLYVVFVSVYVYSFLGILSPSSAWFWVERFLDLSFLTDIILTFFTAYYKANGTLERDPKKIRQRYLLSWFFWDTLATFPWDVIALGVYGSESGGPSILLLPRFLRLLRLTKLFRLVRLLRMHKRFVNIEVRLGVKHGNLRLMTLFFTVTLVAHWFACLFFYFGAITANTCELGEDCVYVNWFEKDDGDIPEDNFGRYVAALYFSVYTITTIGYGDVVPENTVERLYVIVIMFLGAAMFAYVISQVSDIQKDLNMTSAHHRVRMDQLMDFAKYRKLEPELQERIRERFQRDFRRQRVLDEKELLKKITGDLRKEVLEHIYEDQMLKSTLIQAIPKEKRGQVYMCVEEHVYQSGHILYSEGDKPKGFYIIREGEVKVHSADGVEDVFTDGEVFGEEGMVLERAREATAWCMEDTDLIEVPHEALKAVLDETEKVKRKLEEEEALKLWQKTITVVEAQIRYKDMAKQLREKAQGDLRARGIVVGNQADGGAESNVANSRHAAPLSENSRHGGMARDEEERGTDGGQGETDGMGGMEEMREELAVKTAELEERTVHVRILERELERLQNQLSEIVGSIGGLSPRE